MRKKVLCLVMTGAVIAGTMTVGTGTTVYAEDFTSQGDWSVTFNGEGMESSFSSQEMADEIYGILPGDSIELRVAVRNDSREDTDWYMSNEVIKHRPGRRLRIYSAVCKCCGRGDCAF